MENSSINILQKISFCVLQKKKYTGLERHEDASIMFFFFNFKKIPFPPPLQPMKFMPRINGAEFLVVSQNGCFCGNKSPLCPRTVTQTSLPLTQCLSKSLSPDRKSSQVCGRSIRPAWWVMDSCELVLHPDVSWHHRSTLTLAHPSLSHRFCILSYQGHVTTH